MFFRTKQVGWALCLPREHHLIAATEEPRVTGWGGVGGGRLSKPTEPSMGLPGGPGWPGSPGGRWGQQPSSRHTMSHCVSGEVPTPPIPFPSYNLPVPNPLKNQERSFIHPHPLRNGERECGPWFLDNRPAFTCWSAWSFTIHDYLLGPHMLTKYKLVKLLAASFLV